MTIAQLLRRTRRRPDVLVRVRGGFEPSVVYGEPNVPLRIRFRREETSPCSEPVVFPGLGKCVTLPPFEEVAVELVPESPGVYTFTCGLGLLHGRLIVSGGDES